MLIEQPQLRPEVSIRWLTIACFEIRVGDFRIVIDPCIGESPRAPFGPEVIEGADIVLLSHTHWDHITDLAYVMEKFHCPVLCGELSAPALIEMLNANPHDCLLYTSPCACRKDGSHRGRRQAAAYGDPLWCFSGAA